MRYNITLGVINDEWQSAFGDFLSDYTVHSIIYDLTAISEGLLFVALRVGATEAWRFTLDGFGTRGIIYPRLLVHDTAGDTIAATYAEPIVNGNISAYLEDVNTTPDASDKVKITLMLRKL